MRTPHYNIKMVKHINVRKVIELDGLHTHRKKQQENERQFYITNLTNSSVAACANLSSDEFSVCI